MGKMKEQYQILIETFAKFYNEEIPIITVVENVQEALDSSVSSNYTFDDLVRFMIIHEFDIKSWQKLDRGNE